MRFGYRLMRGRQGVSGHVRAMGERAVLSARGLPPGAECSLYAWAEQEGRRLETRTADREGAVQFLAQADDRLFLVGDGRVALWEEEPEGEKQYLLACAWIRKEADKQAAEAADRVPPGEMPIPSLPPDEKEPEQDDPVLKREEERKSEEKPRLRPAGTGEAVDALPILRWPAGTEDLRLNCTLRLPFAPFDAPGWRFVQVPSPLPEAPFCAVGYHARDARVTDIAYAIPGRPGRPPVRLAGYHYRPGRQGRGYWVTVRRV